MDRARAIARHGVPSAQCNSVKLNSFSYTYNKYHNQKHLDNANQGTCNQGVHPLSSRQNAFIPCPISIPCLDYSINVNKGEPVTVQLISKSVMANHPHLTPERCFTEACTPTRFLVKGSISEEGD